MYDIQNSGKYFKCKIVTYAEEIIGGNQGGFRRGR
jgi:hypothetical protein